MISDEAGEGLTSDQAGDGLTSDQLGNEIASDQGLASDGGRAEGLRVCRLRTDSQDCV